MESINYPTTVDWFNGAILSLVIAIVAATINKAATNELSTKKAVVIVFSTFSSAVLVLAIWYNLIGYAIYLQAKDIEEKHGCDIAFPVYLNAVQNNPQIVKVREGLVNCGLETDKVEETITTLNAFNPVLLTQWMYWKEMAELHSFNNDEMQMYYAVSRIIDLYTYEYSRVILGEISKSAQKYPMNSSWISALGEKFHDRQKYVMAEETLRIVRINNGADTNALFWLAWSLYEQKKYQDATNHFDECINQLQLSDEFRAGRCHAGKGFIYFEEGQIIKAKEEFLLALELDPNQEDVIEKLQFIP